MTKTIALVAAIAIPTFAAAGLLVAGDRDAAGSRIILAQGSGSGTGSGAGSGAGSGSGSGSADKGSGSGSGATGEAAAKSDQSASSKAFAAANMKMHKEMDIVFTGDADADFVKGMIPHHQGAVDMAKIVLEHGKDAEVKKLAQEIIKAQETEIAWMREWLRKAGK